MKQKQWMFTLITVFFWASASVLIRLTYESISPVNTAVARSWIGAFILITVCLIKRVPLPAKRDLPLFILAGVIGFALYSICFNSGFMFLTAATGNVILAIIPVFTAVIARFVFKERIRPLGWFFTCVSFSGILILILWNGVLSINRGVFWILAAAILNGSYSLVQRQLTRRYTALQSSAYSIIAGAIVLAPLIPSTIRELTSASSVAVATVIYIGIFSSGVGYLFWSKALSIAKRTAEVTNFLYLPPFIATLLAYVVFKELPDWGTAIGGVVIMLGLLLFQKKA